MKVIVGANFTCGGLTKGPNVGVLDVFGRTMYGLFAAGDCVGSVNAPTGLGGIHLVGAMSLGMVAGRSAADSLAAAPVG
jgi:succinate dehydrogenase/fumarate reductase flavoprotein subunit